ncbi:MAG: hypothetical protein QOH38_610, partial [Thermoleophilaceae bacterium]|nr:hypothetical protein [Thermoleophilaceae bacterium]
MRLATVAALVLASSLALGGCVGDSADKKASKPRIAQRAAAKTPERHSQSLPTLRSSGSSSRSGSDTSAQAGGDSSAGTAPSGGGGPGTYNVNLSGTTYQWNGQTGQYEPSENFNRAGVLIVDSDNEFGVLSGSIAETTAGRLWFVTNS